MTMDEWRRQLLALQQAEKEARAKMLEAMAALEAHYIIRPPG